MKKNLGPLLALYPTPLVILGTMTGGKPNWTLVAHVGVIGHDRLMVSLMKTHYADSFIRENKRLSLNIVTENILEKADYAGCHSGAQTDKSDLFTWQPGEAGTPVIDDAKLVLECQMEDIYSHPIFDNFILRILSTLAEESILGQDGKSTTASSSPCSSNSLPIVI